MSSALRFAVLGPVRAWRADTELDLGSPQQRAVLAVLLLAEGRQVPLATLIAALWENDPPPPSSGPIRTYVSRLRHRLSATPGAVDDIIESAGDGYALPMRSAHLDLATFQHLTKDAQGAAGAGDPAARAAARPDALDLWQGPPLAGVPGHYAESQRVRLTELHLAALEDRLALDIDLGGHVSAAAELQSLLPSYPMR